MINVLFLDDSTDMLEALALQYGLHPNVSVVAGVTEPSEAMAYLSGGGVDLVSVDVRLGPVDGLVVCREIRAQYPTVFVVACSIEGDDASQLRAKQYGAHLLVEKPVRYDDVVHVLSQVVAHQSE